MACENCENGCINPNLCACDCSSCAEAGSCDIPVGDIGPQGQQGPAGAPGVDGMPGTNGTNGIGGCSILNVYLASGGEMTDTGSAFAGDLIITTGPAPSPCSQTYSAGNITNILGSNGANGGNIPVGGIIIWSGQASEIDTLPGWSICDGTDNTPDLRGRFVVMPDQANGATPAIDADGNNLWAQVGDVGGNPFTCLFKNNIPSHVHDMSPVTVDMEEGGMHKHDFHSDFSAKTGGGDYSIASNVNCSNCGGISQPTFRVTLDPAAAGECSGTTDPRCGSHAHHIDLDGQTEDGQMDGLGGATGDCFNTIPPYYALCYIMRKS
tara:strand:+ start:8702 stop:9670 length:969 start_codon:yes stop_codon:yes gene_type:complete